MPAAPATPAARGQRGALPERGRRRRDQVQRAPGEAGGAADDIALAAARAGTSADRARRHRRDREALAPTIGRRPPVAVALAAVAAARAEAAAATATATVLVVGPRGGHVITGQPRTGAAGTDIDHRVGVDRDAAAGDDRERQRADRAQVRVRRQVEIVDQHRVHVARPGREDLGHHGHRHGHRRARERVEARIVDDRAGQLEIERQRQQAGVELRRERDARVGRGRGVDRRPGLRAKATARRERGADDEAEQGHGRAHGRNITDPQRECHSFEPTRPCEHARWHHRLRPPAALSARTARACP